MAGFADNWKELSGDNLWDGLTTPLDRDLRRYLIHYGETTGAIDDAFIDGELIEATKPEFIGLPRYGKANLFEEVGLVKGNPCTYIVKNYVYGSPKVSHRQSNLMAYVAVSTAAGTIALGRRDILIAWRGNQLPSEAPVNKLGKLHSATAIVGNENPTVMVHSGWFDYYTHVDSRTSKNKIKSCRDQVLAAVKTLVSEYSDKDDGVELSITVTGRGIGAAFAILNGMDIVCNSLNADNDTLVTVIAFGPPRIGNEAFSKMEVAKDKLQVLRVINEQDPTPKLFPAGDYYKSIGVEVQLNSINSPYLKNATEHAGKLEVYLHAVASQQGVNGAFILNNGLRDVVMVNKRLDGLNYDKVGHKVLPIWVLHKLMVQNANGRWEIKDDAVDED